MTSEPASGNADLIAYWNGPAGERWSRNQERLDRAFAAMTAALLAGANLRDGEHVVEIGCGCGDLTLALAARLGTQGSIHALDVSQPMLARARLRQADAAAKAALAPVTFIEADAAIAGLPAEADLVISRFGVMFFADPTSAFRTIRGALKPGGRLAMLCWAPLAENLWMEVPLTPLRALIGPEPSAGPGVPGPYAFAEPGATSLMLEAAGFVNVAAEPVRCPLLIGEAEGQTPDAVVEDALILLTESGPAAALLANAEPPLRAQAIAALAKTLRPHVADGRLSLPGACWLYSGRNP